MKKLEKVFAAGLILFSLFTISSCKKKKPKFEYKFVAENQDSSEENKNTVKHVVEKKYIYEGNDNLLDYDEYNNKQLMPIGCKVLIKEDNCVYSTPEEDDQVLDIFYKDEYVTVTQIGYAKSSHSEVTIGDKSNWLKIVSEDGEEGWIRSRNLKMISENVNPVSINVLWTVKGYQNASFSPDGKYVCLKKEGAHNGWVGTLAVYETETGNCVFTYDAASEHDANSSDKTVFAPNGKSIFFEEDLVLKEILMDTQQIRTYERPVYKYGQIGRLLLNKEGTKVYYYFSSLNDNFVSAVCDLKTATWTRYYNSDQDAEVRKEFEDFDLFVPDYDLFDYYPWMSSLSFIKNKNVFLYTPWRTDNDHDGIYFHDIKTGKLIKGENPCISYSGVQKKLVNSFAINKEGTKIAVLGYNSGDDIFERIYYICDLNISKVKITEKESSSGKEQGAVRDDKKYLCSNQFHLVDDEGNWLSFITFKNDNTFSAVDSPNGDPCTGTYTLTAKNGKTYIKFENIKSIYGSEYMENFYKERMNEGIINQTAGDFETVGGITYTDGSDRFITCDKEAEAYKEYDYKGWRVIKYPFREGNSVRLRTLENLKMRRGPSLDSDPVYFTFYEYDSQGNRRSDNRCTVHSGEDFRIMASSVNKEKIDGKEAYWYLIRVWDDQYADYDANYEDVWIFGGYVNTYEGN